MKKINVLKKNTDFDRIIKNNKSYKYKNYILYLEEGLFYGYHFGISVGKKIGNAVIRNRIKRQLRAIIDEKHYSNGFNCIIIVKKGILNTSFIEMKDDLYYAFKKINILEGEQKCEKGD